MPKSMKYLGMKWKDLLCTSIDWSQEAGTTETWEKGEWDNAE